MVANRHSGERLVDHVYGQLLALMSEQNLVEGDRLPSENELSRMAAVSRPIVREALTRLQADGLIESRRGSGSFLRRRPSVEELSAGARSPLAAFAVRLPLEPAAARLAAVHRTADDVRTMRNVAKVQDPTKTCELQLHCAIARASRNAMVLLVFETVHVQSAALTTERDVARLREDRWSRSDEIYAEHLEIVEAIERGDPDLAEAAMRLHLLRARDRAGRAVAWDVAAGEKGR